MRENDSNKSKKVAQQELPEAGMGPAKRKFNGFSMGFLLILLAAVVALYVVCTMLAG